VPLICGIYLYSKTALPFIYVVIRARRATMFRAICRAFRGVFGS
jgi:hypothetical protein